MAKQSDPFSKARGKHSTPYWLKKPDPKLEAKHRRLLAQAELGAKLTRAPAKKK